MAMKLEILERHGHELANRSDREVAERHAWGGDAGYRSQYGVVYRKKW